MSRTRTQDRLSDIDERVVAAAEADLNQLLSIEPSPEFAAKVRARISEPYTASGWRVGWLGLGLVSAAALIIAITLGGGSPVVDDRPTTRPTGPQHDIVLRAPTPQPAVAPGGRAARPVPPPVVEVHHAEVLIDASLAQAIRRLALSTANLALEETTPDASAPPVSDAPVPSVVVEPLRVPELVLKPADQTSGG
jgi:hypothetical protein